MIGEASASVRGRPPDEVARDEDFWLPVQQAFNVDPRYILLNAGGSNLCPRPVHETRHRWNDYVNASPNINTMRSDLPAPPMPASCTSPEASGLLPAISETVQGILSAET